MSDARVHSPIPEVHTLRGLSKAASNKSKGVITSYSLLPSKAGRKVESKAKSKAEGQARSQARGSQSDSESVGARSLGNTTIGTIQSVPNLGSVVQ